MAVICYNVKYRYKMYLKRIYFWRKMMPDYKEMYFTLFREVTKAIEHLQKAQQLAEEMYIEDEDNLIVFKDKDSEEK